MPMPSLGSLASEALSGVYSYSYRLIIPAVMICLIVLSLNLLGDGLREADRLYDISGPVPVYRVKGNCDMYAPDAFDEQLLILAGKRVFITHGHRYGVKNGYALLSNAAALKNADIALCGHTHTQFYQKQDGVILANPGALVNGRYGVLRIENGEIAFKFGDMYD